VLAEPEPLGHSYGAGVIGLCLRLVLAGVSLRGAPRVLALLAEACGWSLDVPDWTTVRLWMMRVGHALLTMSLPQADDWAWLIDHSVQIGQEKCLVVLGIRLCDLPQRGECLRYQDMHLLALVPRASWTGPTVDAELEKVVPRTGQPRVIVDDHGSDIHSGVLQFQQRHAATLEIYDLKHKAACLLKQRLRADARWQAFQHHLGQTRSAVRQTDLAFLAPPAPKDKARFMNLQPQLEWAEGVLDILRKPAAQVLEWVSQERLEEKFAWLREFAEPVAEWSQWQQVVNQAVTHVGRDGITRTTAAELARKFPRRFQHASTAALAAELKDFVKEQAQGLEKHERVPGSSEVLESCFGKMKELEKQQARGGFTGLIVAFGAFLASTTPEAIEAALKQSRTIDVLKWCKEQLGTTLFGKRKLAFASATESG
jgi:hypothetical protein